MYLVFKKFFDFLFLAHILVYMNTKLKKLLEDNHFSLKDRHDFMQIYNLLPDYKRVRVIENFEQIVSNIWQLKDQMLMEQEILFGKTLKNIEERLKNIQKEKINSRSQEEIAFLKNMI